MSARESEITKMMPFLVEQLAGELAGLRRADPWVLREVAKAIEKLIDAKIRELEARAGR